MQPTCHTHRCETSWVSFTLELLKCSALPPATRCLGFSTRYTSSMLWRAHGSASRCCARSVCSDTAGASWKQRHQVVYIRSKINNFWVEAPLSAGVSDAAIPADASRIAAGAGVSVEKEVQTWGITGARTNCAPNIRVKLMFSLKYAPGHLVRKILRRLIGQVVIIAKTTVNSGRRPALATSSDVPYLSRGAIAPTNVCVLPGA